MMLKLQFLITVLMLPYFLSSIACKIEGRTGVNVSLETPSDDSLKQIIIPLLEKYQIPGISMVTIDSGQFGEVFTYGKKQSGKEDLIDASTMFSVGSISKVVNAVLILKLVKDGKLDLDTDINEYIEKWKVPPSKYTANNPVTLRRILSHTAGFSVHGFADYQPGEVLPTTLEILNGEGPAKNEIVEVIFPVGSKFQYSGGGITVTQLIVEEVTGLPYSQAAKKYVFEPLGLHRTSYENPLPGSFVNIAKAHGNSGEPRALPRGYEAMAEQAASGLWTTPSELFIILKSIIESEEQAAFLTPELVADMISPEANSEFGLGPKTEMRNGQLVIFHNGANDSYRAHWKISWEEKVGYIIFTNGANGLDLIKELNPIMDSKIGK